MNEDDKQTFDYVKARRAVDLWVDHLNDKHINWAWEIFIGTADVYANMNTGTGAKFSESIAAVYYDFFDAWHEGTAHYGIIGIMQEFQEACPEEHKEDQERIMTLAWEAGKTGVGVPKAQCKCFSKTVGTKYRPVVERPPEKPKTAGLKLITGGKNT